MICLCILYTLSQLTVSVSRRDPPYSIPHPLPLHLPLSLSLSLLAPQEEDYRRRINTYTNFEHLDSHHPLESRCSFLRCDHARQHFEVHNIKGHIPLKAAHFLMNIRTTTHSFYLTR